MNTMATAIADRIKRRPEAKRTRQRLNAEFGKALLLRGAAKKAKLKKLAVLAETVPGYKIPDAARELL
jgi:hypothetical protein